MNFGPQITDDTAEDARNFDTNVYVNDDIVHRDEAQVLVFDSGFMPGDGMR